MLNTGCGEAENQIRLNQTSSYTTGEGFVDTDEQHNKNTRPANQTQDIQTPDTRPQLATRTQETKKKYNIQQYQPQEHTTQEATPKDT